MKGVKQGLLKPAGIPIVDPEQSRAFQLYYQQAANKLNLVNTVMLESTKQAYQATVSDIVSRVNATQTALDIGAGEVVTGVSSWNQALRHSIERMKQNGITGFIDHGGHRWSAEAYTAMDIRTTVANTARAAVWETNQNFGNDLYLVSYHQGARPLCYPWQNKVISANDRSGVTYDLDGNEIEIIPQRLTSYGEPAGLFGINCKHYPTPFIPGVSLIRGEPQDPEANAKTYEESQKQRALEREIREQKRDLLMMKAQGASNEEIKAQRARIRETDDRIDEFCAETGRARRQSREGAFTQRSFPDPDTYDVTTFERQQKDLIDDYFRSGGVQKDYTFGQTTPNVGTQQIEQTTQIMQQTQTVSMPETVKTGLTEAQKSAVESYVSGDTMYINQVLRGRIEKTAEDAELIKDLDSALVNPIGKTQMLYRSVDAEAVFGKMSSLDYDNMRGNLIYNDNNQIAKQTADKFIEKAKGKTIHEKGYLSTTTDYDVAKEWGSYTGSEKPIVLKLNTPGSTHGLALTDFEVEEEAQSEILLARGQSYKVNNIVGEDGNIVVYADILE